MMRKVKWRICYKKSWKSMYTGQEATVGCGITHWFKIGKGVHQGCILSPCLFNVYAEYIMWNARLDEAQLESIARRNSNNLRYADDTTFMAESEEELKSLLMKVKEGSEKAGLKPNIQRLGVYLRASLECSQHLKN